MRCLHQALEGGLGETDLLQAQQRSSLPRARNSGGPRRQPRADSLQDAGFSQVFSSRLQDLVGGFRILFLENWAADDISCNCAGIFFKQVFIYIKCYCHKQAQ